jgi:hypothetical protein
MLLLRRWTVRLDCFPAVLIPQNFQLMGDFGDTSALRLGQVLPARQPIEIKPLFGKLIDLAKGLAHDMPSFPFHICILDAA